MGSIIEYEDHRDRELLPQFIDLHMACVLHDHMLARFLPPFTEERKARMMDFHAQRADSVAASARHIFMYIDGDAASRKVIGLVALGKHQSETGSFRADVELLLVSPDHRRKGIARRMMAHLESVALQHRRFLLLLDTEEGSDAEFVYPRLGYTELGRVPDYGYSPKDHRLTTGVFFYKQLEKPPAVPQVPI